MAKICPIICCIFLAAGAGRQLYAGDRDAELRAILKSASRANERIRNLSCFSREYEPMDDPEFLWSKDNATSPALRKSPEGLALLGEFQITVDRKGHRLRYDGCEFPEKARVARSYANFTAAFDGSLYYIYKPSANTGSQLQYQGQLDCWRSVHSLLGDGIGGYGEMVGADLTFWLNKPEGWSFESQPGAARPRIRRYYKTGSHRSGMRLQVTLAPEHDYLPFLIETFWCDTRTECYQYKIEQFQKVMPEGVWVPTRGRIQGFYRAAVYPEGVTQESYAQMSAEEKSRIDPLITFKARRLTAPHLIVIDPQKIKINQDLPDAAFVLEYPPTAVVYDEKSGQSLLGGKRPLPKKISPRN